MTRHEDVIVRALNVQPPKVADADVQANIQMEGDLGARFDCQRRRGAALYVDVAGDDVRIIGGPGLVGGDVAAMLNGTGVVRGSVAVLVDAVVADLLGVWVGVEVGVVTVTAQRHCAVGLLTVGDCHIAEAVPVIVLVPGLLFAVGGQTGLSARVTGVLRGLTVSDLAGIGDLACQQACFGDVAIIEFVVVTTSDQQQQRNQRHIRVRELPMMSQRFKTPGVRTISVV